MKRRDGLQGMENQNHQLEGRKTRLLCIGRGLGKEVGMAIFLVPKIRMRKGRSLRPPSTIATRISLRVPPKGPELVS